MSGVTSRRAGLKDPDKAFEGYEMQVKGIWLELIGLGVVEQFADAPFHGLEEAYVRTVTGLMRFEDLQVQHWLELIAALERKRFIARSKAGLLPEKRQRRW